MAKNHQGLELHWVFFSLNMGHGIGYLRKSGLAKWKITVKNLKTWQNNNLEMPKVQDLQISVQQFWLAIRTN